MTKKDWNRIKLKKSLNALSKEDFDKMGGMLCMYCAHSFGKNGGACQRIRKYNPKNEEVGPSYNIDVLGISFNKMRWWFCFEPILEEDK
jgi:hypothetical protein